MKMFVLAFLFITHSIFSSEELLFDLDTAIDHVERKFTEAKVELSPTPHIVIEDIFPLDLYEKLLQHWPDDTFASLPLSWRKSLSIGNLNQWDRENPQLHEIWRQFATFLVDQVVKKKIAQMFQPFLHYKLGATPNCKVACHANDVEDHRLCEDFGVGIGPHIDQAYILSSVVFYFPEIGDRDHESLGTCLYSHRDGKVFVDFAGESLDNVNLEKIIPYKPNTLCALLQTPSAWHSAVMHNPFNNYKRKLCFSLLFLDLNVMEERYGIEYINSLSPTLKKWLQGQEPY